MSVEPAERVTLEPIIAPHGVRETLDGKPSLTVDKRNIVIRIKAFDAAGNLTAAPLGLHAVLAYEISPFYCRRRRRAAWGHDHDHDEAARPSSSCA